MQPATFVINLRHRTDRRRDMEKQLSRVGWNAEFFDAIQPESACGFPSVGARGCFLSHLTVMQKARDADLSQVIILEDDVNFCAGFAERWQEACEALKSLKWSIFYPGHDLAQTTLGLLLVSSSVGVRCTHFIMLDKSAIRRIAEGLETILSRPAGHPSGGPMHVDGAYSTIRFENPDLATYAAFPVLGYQRSSKTDIGHLKWYDRFDVLAAPLRVARRMKTVTRSR